MQEQLLARKVATKKDLSKAITKAKEAYQKAEQRAQAAMQAQRERSWVRGAFVVFQRTQFAADVIQTAPTGAPPCSVHCCFPRRPYQAFTHRLGAGAGPLQRFFTKRAARYQGEFVLSATRPSAPDNYIYENLGFSRPARKLRIVLANLVVAVMLIATLAAICGLKAYQKEVVVCLCPCCQPTLPRGGLTRCGASARCFVGPACSHMCTGATCWHQASTRTATDHVRSCGADAPLSGCGQRVAADPDPRAGALCRRGRR